MDNKKRIPLAMVRGTSREFVFDLLDAEGAAYVPGAADVLRFGIKADAAATVLLVEKAVSVPADGQVTVKLVPADTGGLAPGNYVYDVGVESGEDYWDAVVASPFRLGPNVTKWGGG